MAKESPHSKKSNGKTPIRVLQVITRLIPGGAVEVALNLCSGLKERGFQVELAGATDPKTAETVRKMGIPFHPIPEFRREVSPLYDLWAFLRLFRLIKEGGYQIVHTHTSKAGILGRLAARLAHTPVIVFTPQGSIFHSTFFSLPKRWFFALIERLAALWADKIIAMCQSEVNDYLDHRIAPKEKYIVIHIGINPDRFRQAQVNVAKKKQELGLPEDSFVIGIIARLSPEKGHFAALEAFQKVHKEILDAFLLIVGDGELKEAIRQRVTSMGVEDRVVMTGYRRDIPEITHILDISFNPSLWDCSPRSILEAMVCGVPVVATAVGGIPEMITNLETGLLVPAGDAEAMAHCILRLRKDEKLRKRLTVKAGKRVQELFDPTQTVEQTVQLYLRLLTEKGFFGGD
ncbi:MAG: glycosyltransferase family 4 protein [Candidatus Brocadiales bacterium]|nr:glycosyltransferase family 4 protein [Candidatus Brocadiales bacterium]